MWLVSDLPVFDNVRLVSKKLLGRILSFTHHTFAWLLAREQIRGVEDVLYMLAIFLYMEKALTLNPIEVK
jgi:hypothetical protein